MDVKDFDYDLPEELIAQDPLEDRSSSRLMVLDKKTGEVSHHVFKEIVKYLRPGDCLVLQQYKGNSCTSFWRERRHYGKDRDTSSKAQTKMTYGRLL